MQKVFFLPVLVLLSFGLKAQSLAGKWKGYYTVESARMLHRLPVSPAMVVERRIETRTPGSNRIVHQRDRGPLRSYPAIDPQPVSVENRRVVSVTTTETTYHRRAPARRISFELTCVENEDHTYTFISKSGDPIFATVEMDYEIVGNDTLFLIETRDEKMKDSAFCQRMLLHITWERHKKKKLLRMKGHWYDLYSATDQGEVVLFREE